MKSFISMSPSSSASPYWSYRLRFSLSLRTLYAWLISWNWQESRKIKSRKINFSLIFQKSRTLALASGLSGFLSGCHFWCEQNSHQFLGRLLAKLVRARKERNRANHGQYAICLLNLLLWSSFWNAKSLIVISAHSFKLPGSWCSRPGG